jgi:hypothetical protein
MRWTSSTVCFESTSSFVTHYKEVRQAMGCEVDFIYINPTRSLTLRELEILATRIKPSKKEEG